LVLQIDTVKGECAKEQFKPYKIANPCLSLGACCTYNTQCYNGACDNSTWSCVDMSLLNQNATWNNTAFRY